MPLPRHSWVTANPPRWPYRLNRNSPQAKGLVEWWACDQELGRVRPWIRPEHVASWEGAALWTPAKAGKIVPSTASGNVLINTTYPNGLITRDGGQWSVVCIVEDGSLTAASSSVLFGSRSSALTGWAFKFEQANNTGDLGLTFRGVADYQFTNLSPKGSGIDVLGVAIIDNSSARGFANGLFQSVAIASVNSTSLIDGYGIGAVIVSTTTSSDDFTGKFLAIALYDHAISDSQMYSFYDPATRWDLFEPRRTFVTMPAAVVVASRTGLLLRGVG